MRALCGAIITAGALIGLGLAALGIGTRYQSMMDKHGEGTFQGVYYGAPSLNLLLVLLIIGMVIGLGIAFLGLAYHHERRLRERAYHEAHEGAVPRPTV
jgi:hypothetical protein